MQSQQYIQERTTETDSVVRFAFEKISHTTKTWIKPFQSRFLLESRKSNDIGFAQKMSEQL